MSEAVNKQFNECLNQLKVKFKELNTIYHKAVEQVKPYEEMLFTSTNFKVYEVCYHGEKVLNRYGIDEEMYRGLFEDFCDIEMRQLDDEVREVCGKNRNYQDLLTWIGRTSSFYINPWFNTYGETVEEFVFDYLEDSFNYAFDDLVLRDGNIVSLRFGSMEESEWEGRNTLALVDYVDEMEEGVDDITSLIEDIERCGTIVDEDDFKDCVFLYNYLKNFKENQLEIFEMCYVQPYAEELLEEKKRARMEELKDEENKYKALTNALNIDRETVQDIILLVWNKLTETEKEKLVKLSSKGTR